MMDAKAQAHMSFQRMLFVLAKLDIITTKCGRDWVHDFYSVNPKLREEHYKHVTEGLDVKGKHGKVLKVADIP
jgi:hypothetical protein